MYCFTLAEYLLIASPMSATTLSIHALMGSRNRWIMTTTTVLKTLSGVKRPFLQQHHNESINNHVRVHGTTGSMQV